MYFELKTSSQVDLLARSFTIRSHMTSPVVPHIASPTPHALLQPNQWIHWPLNKPLFPFPTSVLALLGSAQPEYSSHPASTNWILPILQDSIHESCLPRVLHLKLVVITTLLATEQEQPVTSTIITNLLKSSMTWTYLVSPISILPSEGGWGLYHPQSRAHYIWSI